MTRLPANRSDLQYKEDTSLRNSECCRSATLLALISSMLHRKLRLTLSCRTCRCKLRQYSTIQHLFCFFASNIPETNAHACNVAVAVGCWPGMGLAVLQKIAPGFTWRPLISAHLSQPHTPVTPKISSSPTCLQRSISKFDTPNSGNLPDDSLITDN